MGPKKTILDYVSNGNLVFASEKASIRNDEAYEILVVELDGKSKTAMTTTRQISTSHSVSFAGTKSRVRTLDAPELRLSMFQRSTGPNGNRIRSPEKTIERASEGISSYICILAAGGEPSTGVHLPHRLQVLS